MGDLATLAKRMKQIKKDLPDRVNNLAVEVAERVVGNLVASPPEGTPVDTSQAMSNWVVGVGAPKVIFRRAYSEGEAGSTASISRANVMVAALAALQGRKKPGTPIYISNGAPYIRRLAYEGHSKQSPPGWVEGAVQEARRWVGQQRGRLLS
jgi:hypothetical protein